MFPQLSAFITFLVTEGVRRENTITVERWGARREFAAFDFAEDTFILEEGILTRLENKDPVIVTAKADLVPGGGDFTPPGYVFTLSTGNHAVASIPLLDGTFWNLAQIPGELRSETLRLCLVCCNCVTDTLEISQRDVSTERVMDVDNWLQGLGCPMQHIVLIDRVDETLAGYRRRGQEWRIKPLAWTDNEMTTAIRAAQSRIQTKIRYYHNVKGVHFLTYQNFLAWGEFLRSDPAAFLSGLEELTAPAPDDGLSFLRRPKFGNHHEIELFGLLPGVAIQQIVPALEELRSLSKRVDPEELMEPFRDIAEVFRRTLFCVQMEDEDGDFFANTLYLHITGEVYHGEPGSVTPAFDHRRTALPGATYVFDTRSLHPGADGRTEAILSYIESNVSHGDRIEHVNIYEIRSETEEVRLGEGKTREIVYKTAWNPLPTRIIEKRLAQKSTGYGTYTMVRVQAFRALGISYGPHRLLARKDGASGDVHYFVRDRYPGESFNMLPASSFHSRDTRTGAHDPTQEDPDIVRAIITLMGEAAADSLTLKRLSPDSNTIRYGEGKEIIEFEYDIRHGKEMPVKVWLCSIRGTMGWPDFSCSDKNLNSVFERYFSVFAEVLVDYARQHPTVPCEELETAFFEGFKSKIRALCWNYQANREMFDAYTPMLFGDYKFGERWQFVLWALVEQNRRMDELQKLLRSCVSLRQAEGQEQ